MGHDVCILRELVSWTHSEYLKAKIRAAVETTEETRLGIAFCGCLVYEFCVVGNLCVCVVRQGK